MRFEEKPERADRNQRRCRPKRRCWRDVELPRRAEAELLVWGGSAGPGAPTETGSAPSQRRDVIVEGSHCGRRWGHAWHGRGAGSAACRQTRAPRPASATVSNCEEPPRRRRNRSWRAAAAGAAACRQSQAPWPTSKAALTWGKAAVAGGGGREGARAGARRRTRSPRPARTAVLTWGKAAAAGCGGREAAEAGARRQTRAPRPRSTAVLAWRVWD